MRDKKRLANNAAILKNLGNQWRSNIKWNMGHNKSLTNSFMRRFSCKTAYVIGCGPGWNALDIAYRLAQQNEPATLIVTDVALRPCLGTIEPDIVCNIDASEACMPMIAPYRNKDALLLISTTANPLVSQTTFMKTRTVKHDSVLRALKIRDTKNKHAVISCCVESLALWAAFACGAKDIVLAGFNFMAKETDGGAECFHANSVYGPAAGAVGERMVTHEKGGGKLVKTDRGITTKEWVYEAKAIDSLILEYKSLKLGINFYHIGETVLENVEPIL